jgi:hypothetical protein
VVVGGDPRTASSLGSDLSWAIVLWPLRGESVPEIAISGLILRLRGANARCSAQDDKAIEQKRVLPLRSAQYQDDKLMGNQDDESWGIGESTEGARNKQPQILRLRSANARCSAQDDIVEKQSFAQRLS